MSCLLNSAVVSYEGLDPWTIEIGGWKRKVFSKSCRQGFVKKDKNQSDAQLEAVSD
uniref:Uncharacterized protein n=1 Tax=Hyaloperonospora arabidopsidis (strain Emoy2) TaxID=559515 RepID=M4C208_HYAAE